MRDPIGVLRFEGGEAVRTLAPATSAALLRTLNDWAVRGLVDAGLLLPYEIDGQSTLRSPLIRLVSYPSEWSSAQLRDAGLHTLSLSERLLPADLALKDASAWNVLFDGCRPVFCDHASLAPIVRPQWRAFGQFARHFIFPLHAARRGTLAARQAFLLSRDGLSGETAAPLLGTRAWFSRLAPLLLANRLKDAAAPEQIGRQNAPAVCRSRHAAVYSYCRGCVPAHPARVRGERPWSSYRQERTHYGETALACKRSAVDEWLRRASACRVLDIGSNDGEFSTMALAAGAHVIAIDSDHDSIQNLYLGHPGQPRLSPLIADISDVFAGAGWLGQEIPGLLDRLRGQADVVMMLAVVHHLHLGCGIPLEEIARFAALVGTRHLIYELIPPDDPKARALSAQRDLDPSSLAEEAQLATLRRHFTLLERRDMPQSSRSLLLLRRIETGQGKSA